MEVVGKPRADGEWSTDFCHCSSDCSLCCKTYWCPCVTFGQIAEIVDQGSTSCGTAGAMYVLLSTFTGCAYFYSCSYRSKMRRQYNLNGNDCGDCLKHCCCETRALNQMYRELKIRGYDVPLGWQGNVERQNAERKNAGVVMGAPVVSGGMMR